MNIGFIGAGNMASAIIKGLHISKFKANIYVNDINKEKASSIASQTGAILTNDNEELVEKSDYIVLAIKPDMYKRLLGGLSKQLNAKKPVLISIAAGITLEQVQEYCNCKTIPIIRVMPNVNAMVLEAISGLCKNAYATANQFDFVMKVFDSIGKTVEIEEKHFGVYTAIGGCSPAFAYLYIDALANAAVKHGLSKEKAVKIAAQSLYGSAKMVLDSAVNPWGLIEKVCSPGGSTIEGVLALQEYGFQNAVTKAVDAAIHKDTILKDASGK